MPSCITNNFFFSLKFTEISHVGFVGDSFLNGKNGIFLKIPFLAIEPYERTTTISTHSTIETEKYEIVQSTEYMFIFSLAVSLNRKMTTIYERQQTSILAFLRSHRFAKSQNPQSYFGISFIVAKTYISIQNIEIV
jgi:hypothetical protein